MSFGGDEEQNPPAKVAISAELSTPSQNFQLCYAVDRFRIDQSVEYYKQNK